MRPLSRNIVGLCIASLVVAGAATLWQREKIGGVLRGDLAHRVQGPEVHDPSTRGGEIGTLVALALVCAVVLTLHGIRERRGVAAATERVGTGDEPRVRQADDDLAAAFEPARRVTQALNLESDREAGSRHRPRVLSRLLDVGALLVDAARALDFANPRACELLGCADLAELRERWPAILRRLDSDLPVGERPGPLVLDAPATAESPALRCRAYSLPGEACQGSTLYLLHERMALDALETDLLLASQLRALSRVYRAVTHDLKAPLNAMVLNLDRLQVALGRSESIERAEKTQRYLDVLRMELERLDRSLLALLAETTPAGDGREEFDVRATLREIERLLRPQARLQHVALEAMLPGTAVRISGQRDRLKQAILNVAINALESMSGGGALEMILEARPDAAELRILDTGPGIPAELQPRIFDAHFTTKSTGSGIGLYLARAIVEAHGGEIRVGNRPVRGSEFRLRLPALAQGV